MSKVLWLLKGDIQIIPALNNLLSRVGPLNDMGLTQPTEIIFNVVDSCTLKCRMCINHSFNRDSGSEAGQHAACPDLTFEQFSEVLGTFPRVSRVSLAGVGEPLLNRELYEMIALGKRRHKTVSMITNGTLLRSHAKRLAESGLDRISISLNAAAPEAYAAITGSSSTTFETVCAGVSSLVRAARQNGSQLSIGLSMVVRKSDIALIEPMIGLSDSLGVDTLDCHNLIPSNLPGCGVDESIFTDDLEAINAISALSTRAVTTKVRLPIPLKRIPGTSQCKSFERILYVDSLGGVSGCARLFTPDSANGSAVDRKTWSNEYFKSWRRLHRSDSPESLPEECRLCVETCREP